MYHDNIFSHMFCDSTYFKLLKSGAAFNIQLSWWTSQSCSPMSPSDFDLWMLLRVRDVIAGCA